MPAKDKQVLQDSRSEDLRCRGEEALRESEERYREVFEKNSDATMIFDAETHRFEDANGATLSLYGYTREEFLALTVEDISAEPDQTRALIARHVTGEAGPRIPLRYQKKKDGSVFPVEISTGVYFAGGRRKIIGTVTDITTRKKAEAALRESEEKYRLLVDNAADAVVVAQDGYIKFFNPAANRILGLSEVVLTSTPFMEFIHPDDRDMVMDNHRKRINGEALASFYPFRIVDLHGHVRWVELNVVLIDWDGRPATLNLLTNITERKQAEEALVAGYVKLKHTFSGIVKALSATVETRDPYTAGHQQRVAHLAGAISQEMGLSQEQCGGMQVLGLLHDIGKMVVPAEILSKPGKLSEIEFTLIKSHPQVGYDILKDLEFPWPIAQAVLQHHERLDGSGYPQGLTGSNITLCARILAVTDVVEAMASHRPYRAELGIDQALEEITKNKGILYEPEVVDACIKLFTERGFKFE